MVTVVETTIVLVRVCVPVQLVIVVVMEPVAVVVPVEVKTCVVWIVDVEVDGATVTVVGTMIVLVEENVLV